MRQDLEPAAPSSVVPMPPAEVVRARVEDPTFAEVLGRARAKARGVEYDPELHHPNRPRSNAADWVNPQRVDAMNALIDRWLERGSAGQKHLRLHR